MAKRVKPTTGRSSGCGMTGGPAVPERPMNSGRQNAQVELDSARRRLATSMVKCQTELYKAYTEDGDFREWLNGEIFRATYQDKP